MTSVPFRAAAVAALFLPATSALAQDALAQDAPRNVTSGTIDFGFVQTSGNTEVTTLNAGERFNWARGRWSAVQSFAIVYGRQGDSVNTNNLRTAVRGDYKIDRVLSFFVGVAFDRNTFAGIERRFEEIMGLQFTAVAKPRDTLRLEGGGSVTQQVAVGGLQQNFPSARAAGSYRHSFTERAYFQQNVEFIPNMRESEDWRINTESSVVAPLSARIGLKTSYVIRYDNLPEPNFRTTDRLFTTGIQITF